MNKEQKKRNEKNKADDTPLFASYVFVNPGEYEVTPILQVYSVVERWRWNSIVKPQRQFLFQGIRRAERLMVACTGACTGS